jgi:hypothetical protein
MTAAALAEPLRDFAWWAAEAERAETDWRGLISTVLEMKVVAPCDVCGRQPCATPAFCQRCRVADAKAKASLRQRGKPTPRPTPEATIEAVKQAVWARGVVALKEARTRERLASCDAAARAEIDRWLTDFKTRKSHSDEVKKL